MERDIVDWLRQLLNQRIAAFGEKGLAGCRYGEAADEIERLRREIVYLRHYGNKDCTHMADTAMEQEELEY